MGEAQKCIASKQSANKIGSLCLGKKTPAAGDRAGVWFYIIIGDDYDEVG